MLLTSAVHDAHYLAVYAQIGQHLFLPSASSMHKQNCKQMDAMTDFSILHAVLGILDLAYGHPLSTSHKPMFAGYIGQ